MPETAARDLNGPNDLPGPVRDALADYAADPARADLILQVACAQATDPLPLRRVLYKFYNRQRRFDIAREHAASALAEASRQALLPLPIEAWSADQLDGVDTYTASQIRLALKAIAFLSLRLGDADTARAHLGHLARLDPADGSGASVVQALAAAM
jgi:hypothetical protein